MFRCGRSCPPRGASFCSRCRGPAGLVVVPADVVRGGASVGLTMTKTKMTTKKLTTTKLYAAVSVCSLRICFLTMLRAPACGALASASSASSAVTRVCVCVFLRLPGRAVERPRACSLAECRVPRLDRDSLAGVVVLRADPLLVSRAVPSPPVPRPALVLCPPLLAGPF